MERGCSAETQNRSAITGKIILALEGMMFGEGTKGMVVRQTKLTYINLPLRLTFFFEEVAKTTETSGARVCTASTIFKISLISFQSPI